MAGTFHSVTTGTFTPLISNTLNKFLFAVANQLYQDGKYDMTFKLFKTVSESGEDVDAIFNLAITILYYDVKDVERNMDEAKYWYVKAAEKGNQRTIIELQKLQ